MLDTATPRGRILDAAMQLAARRGWRDLTFGAIAQQAGVPITELRGEYRSKPALLAAFTRAVDDALFANLTPAAAGIAPRDQLFDLIMARFDLLAPYRLALQRIAADLEFDAGSMLALAGPSAASSYWLLQGAGIPPDGSRGWRVAGLSMVHARAFRVWLADEDAGLARTMAALDNGLRRAERIDTRLDGFVATKRAVLSAIFGRSRAPRTWNAPAWRQQEITGDDYAPGSDSGPGPAPSPAPGNI